MIINDSLGVFYVN